MSTIIYGASDDLIEFEGELTEEAGLSDSDPREVVLSTGLRFRIHYNGEWNIKVLDGDYWDLYPSGSEQAQGLSGKDYSDVLVVRNKVEWAVVGELVK